MAEEEVAVSGQMKTVACKVWLDGWRLAVVEHGWKWATVTTFQKRSRRVRVDQLRTEPVDEATATELMKRYNEDTHSLTR